MAFASKIIACLLVLKVYMAAPTESHITCGIVTSTLAQCMGYLTNFSPVPSDYCCAEVKALNEMAQTTPDRRQVCKCLKSLAKANNGFINIELVGTLPTICGVSVPYPFNFSTNCDNISIAV
ncbi:Non-specific lipid-transfer protein 12 [Raphanus sativus]|uniref:Non-specific lipid-transfer protein n=1 Tax=Raphanus sativus TaxID=3726 RepID=A0A6J0JRE3_RAPSA|nr:non-specific lipid-transfer protein 12-like [Raphanus sativus]KAJ4890153.1 Non-specific lipid-transfer protein 12 [Raphanus sativus]